MVHWAQNKVPIPIMEVTRQSFWLLQWGVEASYKAQEPGPDASSGKLRSGMTVGLALHSKHP